jgi:uncharacterized protein with NAD-binding domain and iron-sulfur cluster
MQFAIRVELLCILIAHSSGYMSPLFSYDRFRQLNSRKMISPVAQYQTSGADDSSVKKVIVVGAGWGGLGAAYHLAKDKNFKVTLIDAAPKVGGLIRDGFTTKNGRPCEAGIHGFWDEYKNIFSLVDELKLSEDPFTGYGKQGQYSPNGLEAIWPIYRDEPQLPTGLGQAFFTRFTKLPITDLVTATPLVAAFSEFLSDETAYDRFDRMSFEDLCKKMGVSRRLYTEVFEPMILTGLFAPGAQCSAAAALGMAYFFVLKSQTSFDVRWCRGNVGEKIFRPWVERMEALGVELLPSTRVGDLDIDPDGTTVRGVRLSDGRSLPADYVVLGVGAAALRGMVRASPQLAALSPELARCADLRGTDCVATRLWFDRRVEMPYWANPVWGFDEGVGMTVFDIRALHAPAHDAEPGSVVEVDLYHAGKFLAMSDEALVAQVHERLRAIAPGFAAAAVVDSAVVRIPAGVTWFFPGSHRLLPPARSAAARNLLFAGDYVRSGHGSWSQERAYVSGIEAANAIAGRTLCPVIPLRPNEAHVQAGASAVRAVRGLAPWLPGIPDFPW